MAEKFPKARRYALQKGRNPVGQGSIFGEGKATLK
jgi:hypothetical protein